MSYVFLLAPRVYPVPKDRKGRLAPKDLLVLLDRKDSPVSLARRAQWGHLVSKVCRVNLARPVLPDRLAPKDQPELLARRDLKAIQAPQAPPPSPLKEWSSGPVLQKVASPHP
ncbi:hypothetical protein VVR12_01860 [Rothia sp. LK2588]|uniref:hypothetical protein n=1 Tax=Rothia sp. LK2588 TaxID=3114369 RepID=UPI0034D00522